MCLMSSTWYFSGDTICAPKQPSLSYAWKIVLCKTSHLTLFKRTKGFRERYGSLLIVVSLRAETGSRGIWKDIQIVSILGFVRAVKVCVVYRVSQPHIRARKIAIYISSAPSIKFISVTFGVLIICVWSYFHALKWGSKTVKLPFGVKWYWLTQGRGPLSPVIGFYGRARFGRNFHVA